MSILIVHFWQQIDQPLILAVHYREYMKKQYMRFAHSHQLQKNLQFPNMQGKKGKLT